MSDINFEEDRKESLGAVNEAKELSDQVIKLRSLEDEIVEEDKKIKDSQGLYYGITSADDNIFDSSNRLIRNAILVEQNEASFFAHF